MSHEITRRAFVKESAAASTGALLGAALAAQSQAGQPSAPAPASPGPTWNGKIGKFELSRLMLGGNLLTGFAHARDLRYVSQLMCRYNTDAKIVETLALAEQHGINSLNIHIGQADHKALSQYRKEHGDKIKLIVAVYASPMSDNPFEEIDHAARAGADVIYLWGVAADGLVKQKNMDLMKRTVERMRRTGLPIGIAAHTSRVIVECEKAKLDVDFYQKTLHTRDYPTAQKPEDKADFGPYDNAWCSDAQEVAEIMKAVTKPWIAFKVMAAGAIPPKEAFQYAFDNGADFVLAGMFDFQIADDAQIARDAIAKAKRTRPWRA
jgi:hypothetical protein